VYLYVIIIHFLISAVEILGMSLTTDVPTTFSDPISEYLHCHPVTTHTSTQHTFTRYYNTATPSLYRIDWVRHGQEGSRRGLQPGRWGQFVPTYNWTHGDAI